MQDEDGQYTFSQALQVAALQKKPESEAGNELKTLIEEIRRQNETRNSEALKSIVDSQKALAEEIKNIKNGNGAKQSETVAAHAPPAKVRIFIQDPKSPTGVHVQELAPGESWFVPARTDVPSGEDLEHIREKNRHDERLAEIGDKKNQEAEEKAAKLEGRRFAGEIVENVLNVGTALIAEATGKQAPSLKSKSPPSQQTIEYLKCSCDFDVPVPPGGAVATCPKCNKTVFKCPQCKSGIFAVDSSASEAVCPSCGYKMINEAVTPSSKAAQPPPTPGPAPAGPAAQSSQTGG
jgi:DNA-directed RNA polymerase subunit RPC12/RpoP